MTKIILYYFIIILYIVHIKKCIVLHIIRLKLTTQYIPHMPNFVTSFIYNSASKINSTSNRQSFRMNHRLVIFQMVILFFISSKGCESCESWIEKFDNACELVLYV